MTAPTQRPWVVTPASPVISASRASSPGRCSRITVRSVGIASSIFHRARHQGNPVITGRLSATIAAAAYLVSSGDCRCAWLHFPEHMGPDRGPGAAEIAWILRRSAGLPGSPHALLAHQGRDSVLVAGGEPVADVPAMLAALRLLCDRRDEFVAARTRAVPAVPAAGRAQPPWCFSCLRPSRPSRWSRLGCRRPARAGVLAGGDPRGYATRGGGCWRSGARIAGTF
jgi:hypothetical protein